MTAYHDDEWGIPLHDDRKQFEFLMLEAMQCGLSWNLMINKRNIFRDCFDDFNFEKIALYADEDIERILSFKGMIKSPQKVIAIIENAKAFIRIRNEHESFSKWLWSFSEGKTICYTGHEKGKIPAANMLSDTIAKALKKYGFKYLGGVTVYSHLQACGIINDHIKECFRYKHITNNYPTVIKSCDGER